MSDHLKQNIQKIARHFNDAQMPIVLAATCRHLHTLGLRMGKHANGKRVHAITELYGNAWPSDEEFNTAACSPDHIVALVSMLAATIENLPYNLPDGPSARDNDNLPS